MPFKNLEHDGEIISTREIVKVEKRKIAEKEEKEKEKEKEKLQEEYMNYNNPALWTGSIDDD